MRFSRTSVLVFLMLPGMQAAIVALPAFAQANYYQPGYQSNMGQNSLHGQGGSGAYYPGTLPQPTPPAYGPSAGQYQPNGQGQYQNYPQRMHHHGGRDSMGMSRHHRHNRGYPMYQSSNYNNGSYNPYPFGPPHTPELQIQDFAWAPTPRPEVKPAAEPPPVELLARQKRLVIDEKAGQ